MENSLNQLIDNLTSIKSPRFIHMNYRNGKGELSHYCVLVGFNYTNHVKHDVKLVSSYVPQNEAEAIAKNELIESMIQHIEKGVSDSYTKKGYYTPKNKKNTVKESVKEALYMNAYSISKRVIEPIEYKPTPFNVKIDIKRRLKCKSLKFREFKIDTDRIKDVKINGNHVILTIDWSK